MFADFYCLGGCVCVVGLVWLFRVGLGFEVWMVSFRFMFLWVITLMCFVWVMDGFAFRVVFLGGIDLFIGVVLV